MVEVPRLLKNSIESDSYLLMTDSLLVVTGMVNDNELMQFGIRSNKLCEVYGALRNTWFTYVDFSEEKVLKQGACAALLRQDL